MWRQSDGQVAMDGGRICEKELTGGGCLLITNSLRYRTFLRNGGLLGDEGGGGPYRWRHIPRVAAAGVSGGGLRRREGCAKRRKQLRWKVPTGRIVCANLPKSARPTAERLPGEMAAPSVPRSNARARAYKSPLGWSVPRHLLQIDDRLAGAYAAERMDSGCSSGGGRVDAGRGTAGTFGGYFLKGVDTDATTAG